jgi:hypothetical protein
MSSPIKQPSVSRNRNRFKHLDPLAAALAKRLRVTDAILDGDLICVDETGPRSHRRRTADARLWDVPSTQVCQRKHPTRATGSLIHGRACRAFEWSFGPGEILIANSIIWERYETGR